MKTSITPVAVFPATANQLEIDDSWANSLGAGPRLNYRLQYNAHDAVAASAEVRDEEGNIVTPAVAARPDTVTTVKEGLVYMNSAQWDAWPAALPGHTAEERRAADAAYILGCALTNLNLTAAS